MVLLVDRRAFDLQEEALLIGLEQVDRLAGHRRQASGSQAVRSAFGAQVTGAWSILPWWLAFGPFQRTGMLPAANRPSNGAS